MISRPLAYYLSNIATYKKRKSDYAQKYGRNHYRYIIQAGNISKKIKTWQKTARAIRAREERIRSLYNNVISFMEIPYKDLSRKQQDLTRSLYFRWGLEHNMRGVALGRYIGAIDPHTASKNRKAFIKSLPLSPERRDIWNRFKLYMEDIA